MIHTTQLFNYQQKIHRLQRGNRSTWQLSGLPVKHSSDKIHTHTHTRTDNRNLQPLSKQQGG